MTSMAKDAFFSLGEARPEHITGGGEAILASAYRRAGLAYNHSGVVSEPDVHKTGVWLQKRLSAYKSTTSPSNAVLDPTHFRQTLDEFLKSPKPRGQRHDTLHLVPLIPAAAACSGTIRRTGSPWNAGKLVQESIEYAGQVGENAWSTLVEAMKVRDSDDPWARLVENDLAVWLESNADRQEHSLQSSRSSFNWANTNLNPPSIQFSSDILSVCALRNRLTRRSWTACLETILRLGTVSHTVWLCNASHCAWTTIRQIIQGDHPSVESADASFLNAVNMPLWDLEDRSSPKIVSFAGNYCRARTAFELLDEQFANCGIITPSSPDVECRKMLWKSAMAAANTLKEHDFIGKLETKIESNPRLKAAKTGYTNNLREFWIYTLGRRETMRAQDREYDQGYWTSKGGERNGPWIFRPGQLAILVLVHACSSGRRMATVSDFLSHLNRYGIGTNDDLIKSGHLGRVLRRLGAVVDSPDAESGMALISPLE